MIGIGAGGSNKQSRTGGIYIVTGGGGSGVIDVNVSTLGISNTTVVSGSSRTLTLQLKNSNSVNITTGGATIIPSKSGGTATGTLSSVTDNGDGTYTWTFTGVLSGTAQSLSCTINGVPFGNTQPTCAVTVGAINRTVSTVSIGSGSLLEASTTTVTLQAKDAAGNNLTTGGSTVAFNHTGGTSVISIGATTDVGNGTYTAVVSGTTQGTATTLSATIGGLSVTTSMPTVQVVTASANIVFHADWSTARALGHSLPSNTLGDLLDSNKTIPFDTRSTSDTAVLHVVDGSTLANGRPAPPDEIVDVLRVTRSNVNNYGHMDIGWTGSGFNYHWSDLAIGEVFRYRIYSMMDVPNAEGSKNADSNHFIQIPYDTVGPLSWYSNSPMSDGTQTFVIKVSTDGTPDNQLFILGTINFSTNYGEQLPKFVWYRWEFMLRRDSSTGYSIHARVYNASGTLLYSEDGVGAALGAFKNDTGTQVTMKSLDTHFAAPATDAIRSMSIGCNGGTVNYTQPCAYYWGAPAIAKGPEVSTPWIGPYAGGI